VETLIKKIEPARDAVIVQFIGGQNVVFIECLNKENEEYLTNLAREIRRSV